MMEAEEKEKRWLMKRCGKITSSSVAKLMCSGRRDMTPSELEAAKKQGIKRKTIDIPFGDTAISYLYQVARERRLNKPCRHISTLDMEWGKEHEKEAIECFNHNTFSRLMSCSDDFDEIVFVDNIYDGYGDSPDGYGFNTYGYLSYIAEVKCFTSEGKIEYLREVTKEEAIKEYYWQLISHFLSHPDVEKMYYIVYDGKSDDDPFDLRPTNDPSRLLYWELNRCDYIEDINKLKDKLQMALAYLSLNERDPVKYKIREINDYIYQTQQT